MSLATASSKLVATNNVIVRVAKMIDPACFLDGWVDEHGNPSPLTTELRYRQAAALSLATDILREAAKEGALRTTLADSEIQQWEDAGIPVRGSAEAMRIIRQKYLAGECPLDADSIVVALEE